MLVQTLLSDDIVPVSVGTSASDILLLMDDFKVSHLPIVREMAYVGLISEDDILDLSDTNMAIDVHTAMNNRAAVNPDQHILEALRILLLNKLSLLPVVDDKGNYIGCITSRDLLQHLSIFDANWNTGGIIVLEMSSNDYDPTELVRLISSNDMRLLALLTGSANNSTKITVTLKLSSIDITPLLQTFYRYNYTVLASFGQNDYNDVLKSRFDSLMHYLNI
ncbi:MAG: CBS domain-containing protein [Sphingobacteriia bacterium]|nr:CBS domain-containing protein [Sphingobacteriia bacterium]